MVAVREEMVASYSWACGYANSCTASFSSRFDREELKSVGIFGYVMAATRFDETKGTSFRGFCAKRIRGAILDELRRYSLEPRSSRRSYQRIATATLALEAELQRKPTSQELAKTLEIAESDLLRLQSLAQPVRCISLDDDGETAGGDEALPLREILPDQRATLPGDQMDSSEIRRALCASISKLPPAEATVIVLYYLRSVPFHEIAQKMNLTASRISQLHHQALSSLKKHLAKKEA